VVQKDNALREANQARDTAQSELAKKTADENQRAAIERASIIVKDSGKTPQQILDEGAAADRDIQRLARQGYDANRIQREGENALRDRDRGGRFDQGAIDRLEELKNDTTARDRLAAYVQSLGDQGQFLINIINAGQRGIISLQTEKDRLQQQNEQILRWMAQRPPT